MNKPSYANQLKEQEDKLKELRAAKAKEFLVGMFDTAINGVLSAYRITTKNDISTPEKVLEHREDIIEFIKLSTNGSGYMQILNNLLDLCGLLDNYLIKEGVLKESLIIEEDKKERFEIAQQHSRWMR